MAKAAKKKSAKKKSARGGYQPGAGRKPSDLHKGYASTIIKNPFQPFEIEENPPPPARSKYASIEFVGRVRATLDRLKPGQAFNLQNTHSLSWMRKQLADAFPEHMFVVAQVPDNDKAVRIYLKA